MILLSPKASELLKLLLERGGAFVSKEEIFETVWSDRFVEDGVLTQNIYTLRKVLGKDDDDSPLIENRTQLGYRITVPVSVKEKNGIHKSETNGNPDSIEEIIFEDSLGEKRDRSKTKLEKAWRRFDFRNNFTGDDRIFRLPRFPSANYVLFSQTARIRSLSIAHQYGQHYAFDNFAGR
ncbi:MAG: winged helix-turn-helix domain-containing protein [Actinomycetota bacterium]